MNYSVGLIVLSIAVLGLSWFYSSKAQSELRQKELDGYKVVASVPRLKVSPDFDFAVEVSSRRQPVILENTIAMNWSAIKWTPEYVAKHVSELQWIKNSTENVFVLAAKRKLVKNLPLVGMRDNYSTGSIFPAHFSQFSAYNVSVNDFLKSANTSQKVYYFGPITWWPELANQMEGVERLHLHFADQGEYKSETSIWMGNAGVTAHCHFDMSHNFFVQLYGTKRFILFPPEEWEHIYLYPHLHTHYHQSQVDWDNVDAKNFPKFSQAKGYEAVLHPGDMMYLPPFWFHRVESVDFCISASTLSPSEEEVLFNKGYWKMLPFSNNWSLLKKIVAVKYYISMLTEKLNTSKQHIVRDVLKNSRYIVLADKLREKADKSESIESLCKRQDHQKIESTIQAELEPVVKEQVEYFGKLQDEVRDLNLAGYFEELMSWAVEPQNVISLLDYCF